MYNKRIQAENQKIQARAAELAQQFDYRPATNPLTDRYSEAALATRKKIEQELKPEFSNIPQDRLRRNITTALRGRHNAE